DQRRRRVERILCLLSQRVACGELVAVAKHRTKRRRKRPGRRHPPGKVLIDRERLDPAMEPFRPAGIGVAVGYEGPVFQIGRLAHAPSRLAWGRAIMAKGTNGGKLTLRRSTRGTNGIATKRRRDS